MFKNSILKSIPALLLLLMQYNNSFSQVARFKEQIKLNTDRNLYCSGESILFSAQYFINEKQQKPILSNILYVDLLNCDNSKSIAQKKYKLKNYNINGQLKIPSSISTGNYILRIFTQNQRNHSIHDYSYQLITVINPEDKNKIILETESIDSNIYIFPESSILLNEVENKIVIKFPEYLLNDSNEYFIKNNVDSYKLLLQPNKEGLSQIIGSFSSAKKYFLTIINGNDAITKKFPNINNSGIQTNIYRSNDNINYKIINKDSGTNNLSYQINIYSNKLNLIYSIKGVASGAISEVKIPENILRNGINYITLWDSSNVCLKINSIFNDDFSSIDIRTDSSNYKTRSSGNVWFNNESNDDLISASISIRQLGTRIKSNIPFKSLNNGLTVENYIYTNKLSDESTNQILIFLDNQIDERKILEEIDESKINELKYIPEIRELSVSGILRNRQTKQPIANAKVFLSVLENSSQFHISNTNEDGHFIFSLNKLYQENKLYLCVDERNKKIEGSEILIQNPYPNTIPNLKNIPVSLDEKSFNLLLEIFNNHLINKEFQISDKNKEPIPESEFNINGSKITIYTKNFISFDNVTELFNEVVPNVRVKKSNKSYIFQCLNDNLVPLPETPLILLNNIPIFNNDEIAKIAPKNIEKIEVINKPYLLGEHILYGVIMITTKDVNLSELPLPNSASFITIKGLEYQKEYNQEQLSDSNLPEYLPDFRTILYWNPLLKISNEKKKINFSTSDRKGTYIIEITGFNKDGEKFYGSKQIVVK
jgi:hypothetical protein